MKSTYILAAVAAVLLLAKHKADAAPPAARVGELSEAPILDGTNWTTNLWHRFSTAGDLKDPSAPNVSGTASADFSGTLLANTSIAAGWDGGLK